MPEDRLGDLGRRREPVEPDGAELEPEAPGSAAARWESEDERDAREEAPEPARPASAWALGIGLLMLVGVILAALAPSYVGGPVERRSGVTGLPPGAPLPDAAAPLASGRDEGDANVTQRGEPGARPACEVRAPGLINLCDARARPLALTFVVLRGTDCEPWLEVFDRASREEPGVRFVAVVSGESRAEVQDIVRRRGLRVPVAVDPDGALVNLHRVAVCPTTIFARPPGRVTETRIGSLAPADLIAAARRAARAPR